MKGYIAAVDIGTSGCKAMILDAATSVIASAAAEYPLYSPRPGWNEQEPADWWRGVCQSLREALHKSGLPASEIGALSLSGQMHGLVPLDRDGRVIRRAILWNDSRCDRQCAEAIETLGGPENLLSHTNNSLLPGYQGGKLLWLRQQEPRHYEAMARALLPKDYIRFLLTGELATDVSDASGTGLFDVRRRVWSEAALETLALEPSLFPAVYESDQVTGAVTARAAEQTGLAEGTPVIAGGGDAVIQTTGMGLIQDGVLGVILGTSGIVAMGQKDFRENHGGRLQFFAGNARDLHHVMGVQLAAGGSYQWHRNVLCGEDIRLAGERGVDPYTLMDRAAASAPPGSRGVMYLPFLSGERCPVSDPNLRAAFLGLSQGYGKAEMNRAVMEGVTYGLRQISELICEMTPAPASHIIVSGGGSASPLWRQIVSDIFQLPVYTVTGSGEGGAFGACLVGGVGIGLWRDLHEACGFIGQVTAEEPNPANKAVYDDMLGYYRDAVAALKPLYDRMSRQTL